MRNMSNIPKLQAHTKRSSCCGTKVAAHNKEVPESALTSQWLSCTAVTAAHSSPDTPATRVAFASKISSLSSAKKNERVWQKKRRNAKYELGMISTRGGKRTGQRRGVENTRAHAKVFVGPDKNANSSPDIRLVRRERAGAGRGGGGAAGNI